MENKDIGIRTETISGPDRKRIIKWDNTIKQTIQIDMVASDDSRTNDFRRFCDAFSALAANVSIVEIKGALDGFPAIHVGDRLIYQALPLGPELEPFLAALQLTLREAVELPPKIRDRLERIQIPVALKLFIAPQCPFCPDMVRRLTPLIFAHDDLRLSVIDASLFPEASQRHKVLSVPTLLLDERMRWTAVTPLEEILDMINHNDLSGMSAKSIRNIIDNGEASRMVDLLLRNRKIPSAFFDLIVHEKWPVRLGAMVVIEGIAEKDRALASMIIEPLEQRLDGVDKQIQGDVLYLFGQVGNRSTIAIIEKIMGDSDHTELHEAGMDAIASIQEWKNQ